jgi:3-dehydroquinate dehydratase-2
MKICIINGPNLNLLGQRETAIYGDQSFIDYYNRLIKNYPKIEFNYFQSNIEGEIIDKLHEIGFDYDGIILNAAAYTHTSIGIGDAVKAIKSSVIEVHISNVTNREIFRHNSYIAPNSKGIILGFGLDSYRLAIEAFINSKTE